MMEGGINLVNFIFSTIASELLHFHSLLQRVALLHSHLKHVINRRAADDEDLGFQYRLLTR